MKGYKEYLIFFSASIFSINFFLIYSTTLTILIVQSNIPVVIYLISMFPQGYAFFDIFRGYDEGKYVLGAAAASTSISILYLIVQSLLEFLSGPKQELFGLKFISNLQILKPAVLFLSMLIFFNLTVLTFYYKMQGVDRYEVLYFYLVPVLIYSVPVLL